MPVRFIGIIGTRAGAEGSPRIPGPSIDPEYTRTIARAHEDGGFDSVLIGYFGTGVDSIGVAYAGAAATERLGLLIAHRPGVVAPTLAARQFSTLDHFSKGRIALNIVTGLQEADQRREGDFIAREDRYRRTDEYLHLLRTTWTSPKPFDYEGEFYRVQGGFNEVKPLQQPHIPLYISGASPEAVEVNTRHGDVYMLWGEPLAAAKERIDAVKADAARAGRNPGISISFRPILGATEEKAWTRAHDLAERIANQRAAAGLPIAKAPDSVGGRRLFGFANQADVLDERLYTGIARITGAGGNSTAIVGTPDQVADTILQYIDIGATHILIRGFDSLADGIEYGRDLLPVVHAEVRKRERQQAVAV